LTVAGQKLTACGTHCVVCALSLRHALNDWHVEIWRTSAA